MLTAISFSGIASAQDSKFTVNTGNTDAKLGALSRRPSVGKIETETADDFDLKQTTVISGATITGLISPATPLANIANVEVEMYHVFPLDSANPNPLGGNVPTRFNSPSDVEIDSATRDAIKGNLRFSVRLLNANTSVAKSVLNGINKKPNSTTHGDGPQTGEEVEIAITFINPIVLPAGHYFFRPEVLVTGGDFFFMSAPKPIVAPGTAIAGDLQAWIRNSNLSPDWLRIGADIINDTVPPPAFNMTFSLTGNSLIGAGTPGKASCHGETISNLTAQFGSIDAAAAALGFSSVQALQDSFLAFCD
ncbi:MAG TPA: hypothetical protein VFI38_11650 [Candidatus Acidoferrum sp.]|nr:hypothetical protein [Candidatus Acidoferrum sp.]